MELNLIARECHIRAMQNGWWPRQDCAECHCTGTVKVLDKERSIGDMLYFAMIECPKCFGLGFIAMPEQRNAAEQIALMHSELSEALEALREKGTSLGDSWHKQDTSGHIKPEGPSVELVDCIIRIFDSLAAYGVDIEAMLLEKLDYNDTRGNRHGGKAF